MKKLISYLLVFVLAFSTMSAVTFAKGESLVTADKYRENVVTGLGFVNAKLSEKEYITRADFALVLANLMNEPVKASGATTYSDVQGASKETAAIELMRGLDLMVGVGDNQFAPNQPILYGQAVRLILKATKNVKEFNSQEIVVESNRRILTKGISLADSTNVDYTILVKLVYNALDVTVPEQTYSEPGTLSADIDASETLLKYFFEYCRVRGILEADAYSSIISQNGNGSFVTINGVDYKSEADYNKFLGCSIDAVIDEDNQVVFLTADDENNVIKIDKRNATYSNRVYSYTVNGKTERVKIPDGIPVAYNDRVMTGYTDAKMLPQDGYAMLIDNNDDNAIDVVRVIEYVNIKVQGASTDEYVTNIFDASSGKSAVLRTENGADTTMVEDANGAVKQIKDVKTGVVASVIGEVSGDVVTARRVILSTETLTGRISLVDTEDNTVTIGDTVYYVSQDFDATALSFERDYVFSLDFLGKIASAVVADAEDLPMAIGYVIEAYINADGICTVKVLTPYDKIIKYKCAQKVKVVGESGRETNHNALKYKFDTNDRLIAYTVDEEKDIDKVMFSSNYTTQGPSDIPSEFGVYKTIQGSNDNKSRWYPYFKSFFGVVTLDDDTVIFSVPTDLSTATDEQYKVLRIADIPGSGDKRYNVDSYIFDKDSIYSDVAVIHASVDGEISTSARLAVIKKIETVLDEDDEVVVEITLIGNVNDKGVESVFRTTQAAIQNATKLDTGTSGITLEVGDAVLYKTDIMGEIPEFQIVYDFGTKSLYSSDFVGDTSKMFSDGRRIMPAYVYSIDNKFVHLLNNTVLPKDADWSQVEALPMDRVAVVVVEEDAGKTKVRLGSTSDVDSYKETGKSSFVIMNTNTYIGYVLVVIK